MSDVKKLKIGNTVYDIVDATAAHSLGDVAVAGDNIMFNYPIYRDYIESSDKINNPTISNAGMFTPTESSYLKIESSITNYSGSLFTSSYDWSWTVKFKTPASLTTTPCRVFVFGEYINRNANMWCSISEGGTEPGSVSLGIHLYSGWITVYNSVNPTVLEGNTWYWLRVSRDITNGQYKMELSTDGINWNTEASYSSSSRMYNDYAKFFLSQVDSVYTALEYDLTGLKFTSDYSSGIDWVAWYSADKTEISSPLPSSVVQNTATGQHAFSIGEAVSSGNCNVAIGWRAYASNESIAIGNRSTNSSSSDYAKATGYTSIAIGYCTEATGSKSVAIGGNSVKATQDGSTAIGGDAESTAAGATALGYIAKSTANYAIQLGRGTNSTANTLSVGLSTSNNYTLLNSDGTIPGARIALSGASAPDTSTVGSVGQFYVDTTNQDAYICVSDASSTYTWKKITA